MRCKICGEKKDTEWEGKCNDCAELDRAFDRFVRTAGKRRALKWVYDQQVKLEGGTH
jgi:predicted ATP-dependent serine protease